MYHYHNEKTGGLQPKKTVISCCNINYGFVARGVWIPGRKAAGGLRRLRPAGQTGLRVEVILRLPEATLQGYRGKSGGRLDAFHPPFPSPAVLEAQRTPPGERPPEVKNH